MKISLSAPDITDLERKLVTDVLNSNYLSMGPMVEKFEQSFARYVRAKHAIAVNSGTSGLHLLVRALNLQQGDEVITTPFSFVASANCLLFEQVKPVFVDIDENSANIDPKLIEEKITAKTKAILPVHVFGRPAEMDMITALAKKYSLKIIEDACEAIGAEYKGKKVGNFGDGAVFAFYPNKQMTTGEGGMIVTNSDEVASACLSMRNQGRNPGSEWLVHDRLGYNYRMDELSAALGVGQLGRIEEILKKRNQVASLYCKKLRDCEAITLPSVSDAANRTIGSWFVFVIRLDSAIDRDQVQSALKKFGIDSRPYFSPIHLQSLYKSQFGYSIGDYPITEKVSKSTLALPFHSNLTEQEIDYVCNSLKQVLSELD